ncbi:MAG: ribose-5-phosphate isomerase RpiA [Anaerolineae bacterium]|nr:ribose-5-phosphate isomerase RpiA [Anaerolineae bacterium]
MDARSAWKQQAAERAVDFVRPGMVVGLGHGSTTVFALRRIAALIQSGGLSDVLGIPCSSAVEAEAQQLGIPLTTLEAHPTIDVTIDGADEATLDLDLIKGGGGALLREKIVAQASRREVIVADVSKLVPKLGTHWPVPVEVAPFGWRTQVAYVASLGGDAVLRRAGDGAPFRTDQGNYVLDCRFGTLDDPQALAARLGARAGIVEHGLFLGLATDLIVADAEGVRHYTLQRK